MSFEIFALPAPHKLEHLDVQYFHNEPKPGVAEHVLKIQFRTHKGKEQKFIVPLTADAKRLGRKAREKLTPEHATEVVSQFNELRKLGMKPMFGFRQVTLTKRTAKGGRIFQRKQDAETYCWFRVEAGQAKVSIAWAGEVVDVAITPHEASKEGQSLGIGYWNRTQHLKKKLENMNGNVQGEACRTEVPGAAGTEGSEADRGKASGTGHGAGNELAAVGRQRETSHVGDDDQASVARKEREHKGQGEGASSRAAAKPAGSRNQHPRKGIKGSGMDSPQWGAWEPETVPVGQAGLGLTVSIDAHV
jgi:hypothetical protein